MASHKVRLSIDLHSIKNPKFKGQIISSYKAIDILGISKAFRTSPAVAITSAS
jgi:hypothetical protein